MATTFDFTADGGLLPAAELCAGVGACRKKREGTMCPSFQATRDEKDSTRGRANLLRMAITGQLGLEGFTDPAVHEVLDLCLECKACKSECPTNVDMARLKAEFLHQYHRKHGLPWRNRVFGHVAELGRIGSALAPVSSWLMQSGLSRWLNERLLGIDRRRMPPAFARRSLVRRFSSLRWNGEFDRAARRVLLFPDTFANYFEPEVGAATIELLQRAGCEVTLGPPGLRCCGRPLISNGLLDQAVANARHNVERLHDWASRGGPIIACEPSCILTIKDDYPALLKGQLRAQAETVARACLTFEEYFESILAQDTSGHARLEAGPPQDPRASALSPAIAGRHRTDAQALASIPGAEVIDLDAGCCGMAGSFGYETEHYEISRLVGEQRLLPAVRQAEPGHRRGCAGVLVPAADPAFHRAPGGSSRRDASILYRLKPTTGTFPSQILMHREEVVGPPPGVESKRARSQNGQAAGPFYHDSCSRRRFFNCQPPANITAAINPRTAELGSGTEIAPNRPSVLFASPAVKKSVSAEPAPAPLPKLIAQSSLTEKGLPFSSVNVPTKSPFDRL